MKLSEYVKMLEDYDDKLFYARFLQDKDAEIVSMYESGEMAYFIITDNSKTTSSLEKKGYSMSYVYYDENDDKKYKIFSTKEPDLDSAKQKAVFIRNNAEGVSFEECKGAERMYNAFLKKGNLDKINQAITFEPSEEE